MEVDSDGNIYIGGYFEGTVDFDFGTGVTNLTSSGGKDIFFAKYDSLGGLIWAKSIGQAASDDVASAIAIDGSGNLYVTGTVQNFVDMDPGTGTALLLAFNATDVYFAKYDSDGDYVWAKSLPSNGAENSYSIKLDGSDNIFLYGNHNSIIDMDPDGGTYNLSPVGGFDVFFAKYDNSGSLIWAKNVGGSAFDRGADMVLDAAGRVYICGQFWGDGDFDPDAGTSTLTHTGNEDFFFGKYDTDGSLLWVHGLGSADNDLIPGIAVDASGNVYIAGGYRNTIDFDPSGSVASHTSQGSTDIILGKYDSNGAYVESISLGAGSGDYGTQIKFDTDGKLTLIGRFSGSFDFDYGTRTWNLSATGSRAAYILRLDTDLTFITATALQVDIDPSYDHDFDIHLLDGEDYLLSGFFVGTGDFDPREQSVSYTSSGGEDIFLARYSQDYVPSVSSLAIEQQAFSAMILDASISDDGDTHIEAAGVLYDTLSLPTLSSSQVTSEEINSSDGFSAILENLNPGETYYARPYVINTRDTAFGNVSAFIAPYQLGTDGNQDGILDSDQPNIHTILSRDGSTYLTFRASSGDSLYDISNSVLSEELYTYPWGIFDFKINEASADVELIFHDIEDFSQYGYRKKNQFDKVVDFSLYSTRTARIGDHNATIVTLSLTDGGEGDYDGEVNGVIHDPGGPSLLIVTGNIPVWDWWWALILLAVGWLVWRKK